MTGAQRIAGWLSILMLAWWHPTSVKAQDYLEDSVLRKRVEALVKDLDANREVVRDEAEKQLMEIGAAAVPYLPPVTDDASDEFRMRLDRVRVALLERDKKMLTEPTRVTIQGTMTAREAFDALEDQTGNRLPLEDVQGLEQNIDIDLDDMLYWEAVDELLDKLGLTVMPIDGDALRMIPRTPELPQRIAMASYAGNFRLEPIAVMKEQRLYEPELSSTSIELSLMWEPRLNPVFVRYELEGLELTCDNGEVLRPKTGQGSDFAPTGSQLIALLEFDRPTRSAKEIVSWKGIFRCAIPGKPVAIGFKDLDEANSLVTLGDIEVTLEKVRENRDVQEILLGITLRGDQGVDSMQGWTSLIDAYLRDKEGDRIEHVGWSTTRITDRGIGLSFLFEVEEELKGYEFVFTAPQSILQQSVEYNLGSVPLP
jgi:hypothetical protein